MTRSFYDDFLECRDPKEGWLTLGEAETIISSTENSGSCGLRTDIDRTKLIAEISSLACFRMRQVRMASIMSAKQFHRLEKAFKAVEDYSRLAVSLATISNPPSPVPREWFDREHAWMKETKQYHAEHAGGPHKQVYNVAFYQRALGLFRAAFGREIVATASSDRGSPDVNFMHELLESVRACALSKVEVNLDDERKMDPQYLEARKRLISVPTHERTRDAINRAIDCERDEKPSGYSIEVWADFFEPRIIRQAV